MLGENGLIKQAEKAADAQANAEAVAQGIPTVTMDAASKEYKLLFDNVEKNLNSPSGRPYWLASRGVYGRAGFAIYGPGGVSVEDGMVLAAVSSNTFTSENGYEYEYGLAVRPVVVLGSGVTKDVIGKTEAPETITAWEYTKTYSVSE